MSIKEIKSTLIMMLVIMLGFCIGAIPFALTMKFIKVFIL